jgi:nitroreductase
MPEIAERRSIRKFKPTLVPAECVAALLEAARLAPSSVNLQHFRAIVAQAPVDLAVLRSAAYNAGACATAPLIVVCLADLTADAELAERVQEMVAVRAVEPLDPSSLTTGRGTPFVLRLGASFAYVNAAIAVEHMVLQAQHLGLGSCWVHHFDHSEVREHYALPDTLALVTLLAVGYADEAPTPRPRRGSVVWVG